MTAHAPGPWRDETDSGDLVVLDATGDVIAYFGNMEDTEGEDHANARLVASAPELATLLLEARTYMAITALFVRGEGGAWEAEHKELHALCERIDPVLDRVGHPFGGIGT